jgi:DNA replication protein DnaC
MIKFTCVRCKTAEIKTEWQEKPNKNEFKRALYELEKENALCPACLEIVDREIKEQEAEKRREDEKREAEARQKERKANIALYLDNSNFPPRFLEPWDTQKGNNELLRFVRENSRDNLFICSIASGQCKTRACVLAANELIKKDAIEAQFYKTTQLVRSLTGLYSTDIQAADKMLARLSKIDLLILDDLCKEQATGRGLELIYELIDDRYNFLKTTWITSNYGGADVQAHMKERGEYLIRRIRETYKSWQPASERGR